MWTFDDFLVLNLHQKSVEKRRKSALSAANVRHDPHTPQQPVKQSAQLVTVSLNLQYSEPGNTYQIQRQNTSLPASNLLTLVLDS